MTLRLPPLLAGLLALLVSVLLALAPASAKPTSGGSQLFETVALEHQRHIQLASLENFDYFAKTASECCNATNTTRLTVADFPQVRTTVSQKQNRHIEGRPEYRGGGTLSSQADAQRVLDAYHSGDAVILGQTLQGFPVVRFNGVTGTNNNAGAGITNQPTNVFIVKGTASPSIVPANPNWTP